jgi:DNA-binding response OmpR family regulator
MRTMTEPIRVVIADDDADIRMLVTIAVRKAGLVLAAAAEDGNEDWQSVQDQVPDIVVLDAWAERPPRLSSHPQ